LGKAEFSEGLKTMVIGYGRGYFIVEGIVWGCIGALFVNPQVNIILIIGQSTPEQSVPYVWIVSDDFCSELQPMVYREYNTALSHTHRSFLDPIIILC
jgi:hypothetical protein